MRVATFFLSLFDWLPALLKRDAPVVDRFPPLEPVRFSPGRAPDHVARFDLVVDFGTTATVVALVQPTMERVALQLLVGEKNHSSDMLVNDSSDEVLAVGDKAFPMMRAQSVAGSRYFTSLKRYAELQSRQSSNPNLLLHNIVGGFLEKSVRENYEALEPHQRVGPNSQIVVSVPNSFNPTAVSYVRAGVVKAFQDLNMELAIGDHDRLQLSGDKVRVVRESEAIAYLYLRGDTDLSPAPVGSGDASRSFKWQPLFTPQDWTDESASSRSAIIVLDVGGGTTDLSVFQVSGDGRSGHVLLNAGVPIGGTDVDKLIFRSILELNDHECKKLVADFGDRERYEPLRTIPLVKNAGADEMLRGGDELRRLIQDIKREVGQSKDPPADSVVTSIREQIETRIDNLVALSVDGLFELIPHDVRHSVGRILLTGRGSLLSPIRGAIVRQAESMGAQALTLTDPYHLKLAVAYGCALVRGDEFAGSKLPSNTLGRRLDVKTGTSRAEPIASFEASFPMSGEVPTLWHARLPRPESALASYPWWEHRTSVSQAVLNRLGADGQNGLLRLGLTNCVARPQVYAGGSLGSKFEDVYVLWHPDTSRYYLADPDANQWSEQSDATFRLQDISCVTGLPIGFPYEQ